MDPEVAGDLLDGTPFFGEVKWRSVKVDLGMVRTLRERALASGYESDRPGKVLLFFSRSGFRPEVEKEAKVDASLKLISPEMLLAPAGANLKKVIDPGQGLGEPGF